MSEEIVLTVGKILMEGAEGERMAMKDYGRRTQSRYEIAGVVYENYRSRTEKGLRG